MKQPYLRPLTILLFIIISFKINAQSQWIDVTTGTCSLAIKSDGTLWAWGGNSYGNLGTGDTVSYLSPIQVGKDHDWINVKSGGGQTIALKKDSSLWTWGRNDLGQLGTGDYIERHLPVKIGTDKWIKIGAGDLHSLAIKADGTLWGWGSNYYSELGMPSFPVNKSPIPILIDGNKWTDVAGATFRTMALKGDGTIWGCGWNFDGELGNGNTNYESNITQAGLDNDWLFISAGGFNSLAIKNNGTLWGWGWNKFGNLGIGNSITQTVPKQVGLENTWKAVAVGASQTLAIKNEDSLWGWGQNYYGELGTNDKLEKDTPVFINYPTDIVNIYTGFGVSAVLDSARNEICMAGNNDYGQLGDSTTASKEVFECGKFLNGVLAITDITIKTYENNKQIYVNWSAVSESNIVKYEVEKSYNAIAFYYAATVYSKNTGASTNYTWIDQNIKEGNNYYRIKAIDKEGNKHFTSISNTRVLFLNVGISCQPNPIINNSINLSLNNLPVNIYSISLMNVFGQKTFIKNINYTGSTEVQKIDINNNLPKGVYYLIVNSKKDKYSMPVVIN